ncbi:MAG TPA: tetratricopeptide repeat protein [Bacteroidales bacterium]|nr:tetratricopeptide repeat protein [Bacteroidales bacterium]HRW96216.1 tetratricopeptide repeat protein [Bacteroidales bacterium]
MINKLTIRIFVLLLLINTGISSDLSAQRKSKEPKALTQTEVNKRKELFLNASKARILGNWSEAEELYKAVLEIDPNHDASMYELARIYNMAERSGDAVSLMEKAVIINPDNEWYYLFLAELYKQTFNLEKLIETQKKLVNRFPEKIEFRMNLALSYVVAGDFKNAIATYEDIEGMVGKTEEISLQKRRLYLNSNRPKQALAEIESLVDAYPGNVRYLQILAESYLETGQEDDALEIYARIAELDPENPFIHISMADLYRRKGDEKKAIEELKLGFANPSLDLDTKIQVLLSFFSLEEFYETKIDSALDLATIIAKTHPDDIRALSIYGELLYRTKALEEALGVINQVIEKDVGAYVTWEQKLFIENEIRNAETVLATSNTMIELFPMQPLAYLFNGFANYQLQKFDIARIVLETGLKLVVDNKNLEAQFYSTLGDVYNRLGNYEKSDESYEQALRLKPDDAFVLNNYSYYLSLRGENLERAREMAALANQLSPDNSSFQDTYGWVLYQLGEYAEAEKWIKKALDTDQGKSSVILEHYGDVLYKLGRKTEAHNYWIEAGRKNKEGENSDLLDEKIKTGILQE